MSEISEIEIKSMTKEQNYMCGYENGKSDVLDKIRAEIEEIAKPNEFGGRGNGKSVRYGLCKALEIIDKYKAEDDGCSNYELKGE